MLSKKKSMKNYFFQVCWHCHRTNSFFTKFPTFVIHVFEHKFFLSKFIHHFSDTKWDFGFFVWLGCWDFVLNSQYLDKIFWIKLLSLFERWGFGWNYRKRFDPKPRFVRPQLTVSSHFKILIYSKKPRTQSLKFAN